MKRHPRRGCALARRRQTLLGISGGKLTVAGQARSGFLVEPHVGDDGGVDVDDDVNFEVLR